MTPKSAIAVFHSAQQPIELRLSDIPVLKEGELLIRNEYACLCRSDIHTYTGRRMEKSPTILGHEVTGKIAAFGPDVTMIDGRGNELQIGDRLTWAIYASDPQSPMALSGMPQKGKDLFKYGHEALTDESSLHGGLAEFIILRKNTPLVKVDSEVPLKVVSIINCAVATAMGAVRLAGDVRQKSVLVSGAGMLGIIACAICRHTGAGSVAAMDIDAARLAVAKDFGADTCIDAREDMTTVPRAEAMYARVDIVIECSGAIAAMERTLAMMNIGVTAVWVGAAFPQSDVRVNAEQMIRKLLTIKGLHNYNDRDLINAVEFIENTHRKYPFESLIQDGFSLADVNAAFRYAVDKNPYRVGVNLT